MWIRAREEDARRLHREALDAVGENRLDEARALAERLIAMGWAGGYEALALAHRAAGAHEAALEALDEGVSAAPGAFELQLLRAEIASLLRRFADAEESFAKALACEGAWASAVHYNRAVARLAAGDAGGALWDAERVWDDPGSPPFALDAMRVGVDALFALKRREDAISLARGVYEAASGVVRAEAAALLAVALARAGAEPEAIAPLLAEAIDAGVEHPSLLEAHQAVVSKDARCEDARRTRFAIVIDVPHALVAGTTGYIRILEIVAEDEASARALVGALEPSAVQSAVSVLRLEAIAHSDAGPTRVVAASPRRPYAE